MTIFLALVLKMLPLYLMIGLGYIAGRFLQMQTQHIASVMLYIITPTIVFTGVMSVQLSPSVVMLPLLVWCLSIAMSLFYLYIGRKRFPDARANILALAMGTGNTGYFGIPVALLLLGEGQIGLYILCMLGMTLHENSVGFYIAAKGRYPARECLTKVLRLPSFYAALLALALNALGVGIPSLFDSFVTNMRGAYTVFGMMIIGIGMAGMRMQPVGKDFIAMAFVGKFLLWPLLMGGLIALDHVCFHLFNDHVQRALWLLSLTPIAANSVVIAALLDTFPQQVATATLLSTIFALFYIPLMTSWLL